MFENICLGIVQGVAEWLPVSSEGLVVLTKSNIFYNQESFGSMVELALFLHLGTFFAAFIYFRKDVFFLLKGLFQFKNQAQETKNLLIFLIVSTLISGILGFTLLKAVDNISAQFESINKIVTVFIGFLLFGTAYLEIKAKSGGYRKDADINIKDALILGIVQGFATLPGFSRSGLTVSALLLRKFDKACALRLSFLMSMPIVLTGNIILHINNLVISKESLAGLLFSFIFGYATIHVLLKIAQKVNFGIFVFVFGVLTVLSVFI